MISFRCSSPREVRFRFGLWPISVLNSARRPRRYGMQYSIRRPIRQLPRSGRAYNEKEPTIRTSNRSTILTNPRFWDKSRILAPTYARSNPGFWTAFPRFQDSRKKRKTVREFGAGWSDWSARSALFALYQFRQIRQILRSYIMEKESRSVWYFRVHNIKFDKFDRGYLRAWNRF